MMFGIPTSRSSNSFLNGLIVSFLLFGCFVVCLFMNGLNG